MNMLFEGQVSRGCNAGPRRRLGDLLVATGIRTAMLAALSIAAGSDVSLVLYNFV